MSKNDLKGFEAFKSKVSSCELSWDGSVLKYKTVYGDLLTIDTSYMQVPTINGNSINFAPSKVFESPFLNADWNSGIVTISKGKRKKILDFNEGREVKEYNQERN